MRWKKILNAGPVSYTHLDVYKRQIGRSEAKLNRLKELRVDRDLTQRQVATAIGITQRKYSYIETGVQQITEALLKNLAEYYGVSVDYLLNLTDDPTPYPKKKRRA